MNLSLTTPLGALPPSPPHSTEGELIIEKALEGCDFYPPVPVWNMPGSDLEYIKAHSDNFSATETQPTVSHGYLLL